MTKKIRVIRALKDVRTRLRDVAAADHSNASALRDASARNLEDQNSSLESALDEASGLLAAASSVHELDLVAAATGVYRLSVADALERHEQAIAATLTTADRLRERTRQLRTAERLAELADARRAKRESIAERRRSDDMAARRR